MKGADHDARAGLLRARVRDVQDFPKPGILFRDLTPLLADGAALREAVDLLTDSVAHHRPELVVAVESRGFIFGAPVAASLGVGFVPVRKPGKLPYKTRRRSYDLEYGTDALEMHDDAIVQGARVIIVDDLLATGGTARATVDLVKQLGGRVEGIAFLIELVELGGRSKLAGEQLFAVLQY